MKDKVGSPILCAARFRKRQLLTLPGWVAPPEGTQVPNQAFSKPSTNQHRPEGRFIFFLTFFGHFKSEQSRTARHSKDFPV